MRYWDGHVRHLYAGRMSLGLGMAERYVQAFRPMTGAIFLQIPAAAAQVCGQSFFVSAAQFLRLAA